MDAHFSFCASEEHWIHKNFVSSSLHPSRASPVKHLQATFKRYQSEHKLKQDSLERSKTDLKKLRRKSQGKHSSKYEIKENEVRPKPNRPRPLLSF